MQSLLTSNKLQKNIAGMKEPGFPGFFMPAIFAPSTQSFIGVDEASTCNL